jgi:hypothetical protein
MPGDPVFSPSSCSSASVSAQIGNSRDRVPGRDLSDVSRLLEAETPITTGLADARFAVDSLDNVRPHDISIPDLRGGVTPGMRLREPSDLPLRSLLELKRSPGGGFILQPGYWEMHSQSYSLAAGAHGPGGDDGHLYAPTAGPAAEQVMAILRNSVNRPGIEQRDVQTLLWAIVTRARSRDLPAHHRAVAARLLTPQQLAALDRNALDLVPGTELTAALTQMPPLPRQAREAEAALRQMLVNPATTFDQLERVAVLAGVAAPGPGSRQVPEGRWSRHPDGYYIRYLPRGYGHTVTQLWVSEGSEAVGREYDPVTHTAVPGNTARQRLVLSGRAHARPD